MANRLRLMRYRNATSVCKRVCRPDAFVKSCPSATQRGDTEYREGARQLARYQGDATREITNSFDGTALISLLDTWGGTAAHAKVRDKKNAAEKT